MVNLFGISLISLATILQAEPLKPAAQTPAKPAIPSRDLLEADFKKLLESATLEGSWQMTQDGLDGKKPLSEAKTEKYVIQNANKLNDELWLITARIQFGDADVNVPVPVRVIWAEDTAIITLSEFPVPMLGTYSCRVMFHGGFYSGIWYSKEKNYGGVMSGRIVKAAGDEGTKQRGDGGKQEAKSQNVETPK